MGTKRRSRPRTEFCFIPPVDKPRYLSCILTLRRFHLGYFSLPRVSHCKFTLRSSRIIKTGGLHRDEVYREMVDRSCDRKAKTCAHARLLKARMARMKRHSSSYQNEGTMFSGSARDTDIMTIIVSDYLILLNFILLVNLI